MKLLENSRDRPRTKESSRSSAGIDKKFLVSIKWTPAMVSNTKNKLKTLDMKIPSEYSNNPVVDYVYTGPYTKPYILATIL